MQKRQTRAPAYQPVFMGILALTINKIHHKSGICRIFSPLLFHHQGLYLGANPSYIKPLPTQAMLLPKPSPLQILLPQEPAQQEGGSQYFSLQTRSGADPRHNAQTKIQPVLA